MLSFKTRPTKSRAHLQTIEIQGILINLLRIHKDNPSEVAKLSTAYMQAEEKRQILAGIGKPKPVEAKNTRSKSKKHSVQSMIDPTEVAQTSSTKPVTTHETPVNTGDVAIDAQDLQS